MPLPGRNLAVIALILVVVVLVTLALALAVYVCLRRWRAAPAWLFLRLCRAHWLGWGDQWLLWQLARHHRLPDPARLFIEPERFATTCGRPEAQGKRLKAIAAVLFESPRGQRGRDPGLPGPPAKRLAPTRRGGAGPSPLGAAAAHVRRAAVGPRARLGCGQPPLRALLGGRPIIASAFVTLRVTFPLSRSERSTWE